MASMAAGCGLPACTPGKFRSKLQPCGKLYAKKHQQLVPRPAIHARSPRYATPLWPPHRTLLPQQPTCPAARNQPGMIQPGLSQQALHRQGASPPMQSRGSRIPISGTRGSHQRALTTAATATDEAAATATPAAGSSYSDDAATRDAAGGGGLQGQAAEEMVKAKPFQWESHWYPVAFISDLDKSKPHRFVLLNKPLVIWWEPAEDSKSQAGMWRVFEDVCPHRLVPLSEGRINQNGQLECGYHGWSFNGCGECTRIPQGGKSQSQRAQVLSYPCTEKQGLLFVYPDTSLPDTSNSLPEVPVPVELDDPDWATTDTWRDIPYDATTLMENVIDSSHVSFTHHKTMSNRNQVGAFDLKVTEPVNRHGFKGIWTTGPRAGAFGPQATWFNPPCYMQHKLDAREKREVESMVVVYAVPTTPGNCRLLNRNLFKFSSKLPGIVFRSFPKFAQHVNAQTLLEDDQIFLQLGEREYTRRRAAGQTHGKAMYNASPADTFVTMYRLWLDRHAGGGPFGALNEQYLKLLGPPLTVEQHLDRYSQHTQNCATCQTALARFKQARGMLSGVLAFATAAALISCGLTAAAAFYPASTVAAAGQLPAAAQGVAGALLQGLLGLVAFVCGAGGPAEHAGRAALWAGVALAAVLLDRPVAEYESKFYRGVYPPPRNLAKD